MWHLSSPTKDRTCAPCIGSAVLTTGPPGNSPAHTHMLSVSLLTQQIALLFIPSDMIPVAYVAPCEVILTGGGRHLLIGVPPSLPAHPAWRPHPCVGSTPHPPFPDLGPCGFLTGLGGGVSWGPEKTPRWQCWHWTLPGVRSPARTGGSPLGSAVPLPLQPQRGRDRPRYGAWGALQGGCPRCRARHGETHGEQAPGSPLQASVSVSAPSHPPSSPISVGFYPSLQFGAACLPLLFVMI